MRRLLLRLAAFVRAARRLVKKHPETAAVLHAALEALAEDAFHPALKTHKLKGDLAGSWACSAGYDLRIVFVHDRLGVDGGQLACSAGYDLRIVFEFVQHDGTEAILLQTVGTHDEV